MAKKKTTKKDSNVSKEFRDAIWDHIEAIYFVPKTKQERTRIGRIVSQLVQHSATPVEIDRRRQCLIQLWGNKCDTPEALVKHWQSFNPKKDLPDAKAKEHPIIELVRKEKPEMYKNSRRSVTNLIKNFECGKITMIEVRKKVREYLGK